VNHPQSLVTASDECTELRHQRETLDSEIQKSAELKRQLDAARREKDEALQTEQQTISLLVSEKASLTEELEKLQDFQASTYYAPAYHTSCSIIYRGGRR
jgi:hypothetical protein